VARLLERGARVRVLFQGSFDSSPTPVPLALEAAAGAEAGSEAAAATAAQQQAFGLLRDALRLHFVLHVDSRAAGGPVEVDDHRVVALRASASGAPTLARADPAVTVADAFEEAAPTAAAASAHGGAAAEAETPFEAYVRAKKPSSFMLDVSEAHDRDAAVDGAVGSSHLAAAAAALRRAEAYLVMTRMRMPVAQFEGHRPLGRIEWASNRALALVQWPFAARVDAGGGDELRPRVLRNARALAMALNLFAIPPGVPFLDTLAAGWLRDRGPDPLTIAKGLILTPTRRSARALAEALRDYARQHLAGPKVPRLIEFAEELPRSEAGKLLRRLLKEQHAG
jgi:hypothetical protein